MENRDLSDVLILGGGVIGLSIARELRKRGVSRITLIDKGTIGREASWAAAGILAPQVETDEVGPFFELCARSRDLYPQFASELLEETGVDIELERTGTLYLAFTDEDAVELKTRYEWQRSQGMAVEHLTSDAVRALEPNISTNVREALLFPNDWQVENCKLVTALHRYAEMNGIPTIENMLVTRVVIENGKASGAITHAGTFAANTVVIATGAWTSFIELGETNPPVNIEPVRGQIVQFRSQAPILRHVVYSSSGYLVPRADGRILAG
jgi:glycine oxidase